MLAAYGPVGFTGLGMVIKIDTAELNAPLGRRFADAVLLLAGLVAAGVLVLRQRLRPMASALVEAREEATRVAASSRPPPSRASTPISSWTRARPRDAIVDFRVRYMNASGEVLVARPSEESSARRCAD